MTFNEMLHNSYRVGSRIEYTPFGGDYRVVTVDNKEEDVKNGRAGFDGMTDDGLGVWGYDDQITRIIKK